MFSRSGSANASRCASRFWERVPGDPDMRCSLLTLSQHLDHELPSKKEAEVEAHLVGCVRCRNGLAYLDEESQRIKSLAHIHVPDESLKEMMVILGYLDPDAEVPSRSAESVLESKVEALDGAPLPWMTETHGKGL